MAGRHQPAAAPLAGPGRPALAALAARSWPGTVRPDLGICLREAERNERCSQAVHRDHINRVPASDFILFLGKSPCQEAYLLPLAFSPRRRCGLVLSQLPPANGALTGAAGRLTAGAPRTTVAGWRVIRLARGWTAGSGRCGWPRPARSLPRPAGPATSGSTGRGSSPRRPSGPVTRCGCVIPNASASWSSCRSSPSASARPRRPSVISTTARRRCRAAEVAAVAVRDRGAGRPTKRERRSIEKLRGRPSR